MQTEKKLMYGIEASNCLRRFKPDPESINGWKIGNLIFVSPLKAWLTLYLILEYILFDRDSPKSYLYAVKGYTQIVACLLANLKNALWLSTIPFTLLAPKFFLTGSAKWNITS